MAKDKQPIKKRVSTKSLRPRGTNKTNTPKFDYDGEEFYKELESLAGRGFTDRNIAYALIEKFGETLTFQTFSAMKNETNEEGIMTERAQKMTEALARGRSRLNLAVRDTFLKRALGQKKTKTITRKYIEVSCHCMGQDADCPMCGGMGRVVSTDKAIVQEMEVELPPDNNAMSVWLYNHDSEWRDAVNEGKRLDITSAGNELNKGIQVEIIDKREQIEKDTNDTGI